MVKRKWTIPACLLLLAAALPATAQVLPSGIYSVKGTGSACWNIAWNSTAEGEVIQSYPCDPHTTENENEKFQFDFVYHDYYSNIDVYEIKTINQYPGMCLRPVIDTSQPPPNGQHPAGAQKIVQQTCATGPARYRHVQWWAISVEPPPSCSVPGGCGGSYVFKSLSEFAPSGADRRLSAIDGTYQPLVIRDTVAATNFYVIRR
jgi:hypothetical protein